jgi:hypothetical protein
LISQLVVMCTADGKLFVALSAMLVRLWVAPVFTATVNDVALTALNDTVAPFDVRPACADAFAAKIASVAMATGRVRSRLMQAVP